MDWDWLKSIHQVFVLTVRPLRSIEPIWGWVDVIVIVLLLFGALTAGIIVPDMGWLATIVLPSGVASLVLIAAVRLQRQMIRMQGPQGLKAGDTVKGKDFNLSLFLQTQGSAAITNITFDRCVLRGPCLLTALGSIELNGCGFRGGKQPEDMIIEINDTRQITGIAALVHCRFLYCEFDNVSWAVGKPIADQLRAIVKI